MFGSLMNYLTGGYAETTRFQQGKNSTRRTSTLGIIRQTFMTNILLKIHIFGEFWKIFQFFLEKRRKMTPWRNVRLPRNEPKMKIYPPTHNPHT